ncbi:MAG TPA: hypothetical protein VL048_05850 [Xanthobacteraceae bacterium]|nr:hypothetical protein [Xanthobacteraceae bacterium]
MERADFIECAAELRGTDFFVMHHPALDAYREVQRRITDCHRPPTLDAKHPNKHIKAARAHFEGLKRYYAERLQNREQGGLRRLVNAFYLMARARSDLLALEYQAKRRTSQNREANKVKRDAERRKTFGALGLAC